MGSSVGTRMAIGVVAGTTSEIKVPLEFTPRKVELLNSGGLAKAVWTDTMPHDSFIKEITDGTITYDTSGGVTPVEQLELDVLDTSTPPVPLTRGFLIGTDSDINDTGEDIHWVAYE